MQKNYPNFKFFYLLIFLFIFGFSFKGNAQCIITGIAVNSSTITCTSLSGCSIVYVGDGVNPSTLVMNQNLNLTCLGAIQFIIRDNASIDFSNGNYDLELAANSSIIVENGGNISAGGNCSASDLIRIGGVKVASCNGQGGAIFDFPNLVSGGGYNTVKTTLTPSSICGSGIFTIAESVVPTPTAQTTYNWYLAASGGTAFATQTSNVSPFSSTYTTGTLSSTITYYVSATTGSNTTPRKPVTLTINALPSTPTITAGSTTTFCTGGSVTLSSSAGTSYLWSTGATTQSISPTVSGNYTVMVTNASGCQSAASEATVVTVNASNIWLGLSAVWNDSNNWSCGVPTETSDLMNVIPSGVSFYPNLVSDISLKNLTINHGALLNVINNGLTITEVLTLNGKIDLQNESQLVQSITSTLVETGGTGSIEIDQQGTSDNFRYNYWGSPVSSIGGTSYTIGGVLRDGTFPNSSFFLVNKKTINFGAPFTYADIKIAPTDDATAIKLSTYWMYKFVNSGNGYGGWTSVVSGGPLKVGEGFTMKGSNTTLAEQNYTFVGKPNNGDINLTITAGKEYLIGNPYPSAIDARKFIKDNISMVADSTGNRGINIIDGNLYFWDHFGGGTHYLKSYEGGYAIYNLSGGVNAVSTDVRINNTGNSSGKAPQKFIPVAQGFFVTALDGGEIQFKNSQRLFKKENTNVSQFLKSAEKSKSSEETAESEDFFPRIYLNYSSPKGFHRQLLVAFIPNTSDGIDIGYDAINSEIFAEDMSWKANEKKLVIQAVPTLNNQRILPLYLKLAIGGIAKIGIDIVENMPKGTKIFVKDNTTNKTFDITEKPFEMMLDAGVYENRFALTFNRILLPDENAVLMNEEVLVTVKNSLIAEDVSMAQNGQPLNIGIHVFMNNPISELQINNVTNTEIISVNLFNNVGQLVNNWNTNLKKRDISLPVQIPTGIYNVQITTKNGTTVKKIMVE